MRGELIFSFLPFSPFPPSLSPVGGASQDGRNAGWRQGKDYKTLKVFCITTLLLLFFPLARSYQVSSASAVSSAVSTPHVFIPPLSPKITVSFHPLRSNSPIVWRRQKRRRRGRHLYILRRCINCQKKQFKPICAELGMRGRGAGTELPRPLFHL